MKDKKKYRQNKRSTLKGDEMENDVRKKENMN